MTASPPSSTSPTMAASALPWILSTLAGALDGACAIGNGAIHVAFVSGDTVAAGEALAFGRWWLAVTLLSVVAAFILGAAAGAALARRSSVPRPAMALGLVAAAAFFAALGLTLSNTGWALLPLAAGLGAVDALLKQSGATVGLSFISGALLDLGATLAHPASWSLRTDGLRAGLWLVFLAGAVLGALACREFGLTEVLWCVSALALCLAALSAAPSLAVSTPSRTAGSQR